VIGVISWFISARIAKKSFSSPKLQYRMSISPLLTKSAMAASSELKIEYKGELLPEPTLLSLDIINAGDVAIENPPIEIKAVGATYVIPGYFEDVPPGYDALWSIERTDAESCAVHLSHINPNQIAKVRFLLDENPKEEPIFECPMKDLTVKRVGSIMTAESAKSILEALPYSTAVLVKLFGRLGT
jgi:hypothetical protein